MAATRATVSAMTGTNRMSFEISERDDSEMDHHDGITTPANDFVDEFMDKVAVQRILGGSHSIGRNDAQMMLSQFRNCGIDAVAMEDPAVLMLDGTAVEDLEEFLTAGGAPLEDAIRGPQDDDLVLTTTGRPTSGMTRSSEKV